MNKATREDVYQAIDSERNYQQAMAHKANTPVGEVRLHSVEEFLLYMDDYLREAKTTASRVWTPDRSAPPQVLDTIRKVVALGVACMEQHGAPLRTTPTKHSEGTDIIDEVLAAAKTKILDAEYDSAQAVRTIQQQMLSQAKANGVVLVEAPSVDLP